MKDLCCKNYEHKKACKQCPILAEIRKADRTIKRKDVRRYLKMAAHTITEKSAFLKNGEFIMN